MNAGYKNSWRKSTIWTNVWVTCVTQTVCRSLGAHHEWCRFCRRWLQYNYTHVQVGFDKKHELDGVDCLPVSRWPIPTAVQTAMRSAQDEIGGGRSVCFSIVWVRCHIDLIGKYIHHDNDYTGNFAVWERNTTTPIPGMPVLKRVTLSPDRGNVHWAAGWTGLRRLSGKTFRWKDGDMDLSMKNRTSVRWLEEQGLNWARPSVVRLECDGPCRDQLAVWPTE